MSDDEVVASDVPPRCLFLVLRSSLRRLSPLRRFVCLSFRMYKRRSVCLSVSFCLTVFVQSLLLTLSFSIPPSLSFTLFLSHSLPLTSNDVEENIDIKSSLSGLFMSAARNSIRSKIGTERVPWGCEWRMQFDLEWWWWWWWWLWWWWWWLVNTHSFIDLTSLSSPIVGCSAHQSVIQSVNQSVNRFITNCLCDGAHCGTKLSRFKTSNHSLSLKRVA